MAIVVQTSACATPAPVIAERDIAMAKVRPVLVMAPHPRGDRPLSSHRYRLGEGVLGDHPLARDEAEHPILDLLTRSAPSPAR